MQQLFKFGRTVFFGLVLTVFLILPTFSLAATEPDGLVPSCPVGNPGCANPYSPDNYGACEVVQLANNIIGLVMTVGTVIVTIVLVYAGYLLVTSRGNSGQIEKAKELFSNILIGLVIFLSAFLIVNTVLGALVGNSSSLLNWNRIECSYSNRAGIASTVGLSLKRHLNDLQYDDFISTIDSNLLTTSAGVCTSGDIGNIWGSLSSAANCIITNESACGSIPISRSDIGADNNPFSFGAMQINTTVHVIRGCGSLGIPDLDCKDAWSGKDYSAHVTNQSLYNACRDALLNPTCNMINGKRIYQEAGNSWRPWSTASGCGLH